ncbi:MAG TPA: hypothetical protein VFH25_01500 [Nitrososphaeraceae archaeon]|nr:hypothetical protein [Nitrososphaeraceae archaeon]
MVRAKSAIEHKIEELNLTHLPLILTVRDFGLKQWMKPTSLTLSKMNRDQGENIIMDEYSEKLGYTKIV